MARRPTINDLALKANVSVATVDRVLNGRLPVREETKRRVYEAAQELGFHATSLLRQRLDQGASQISLGFLLQKPDQFFYQNFAETIRRVSAGFEPARILAQIEFVSEQVPSAISTKLRELGARCEAVAMVAVDHPTITAAVLDLAQRNIPVFTLLSDSATGVRRGYLGVNNRKAGRTAGWIIHKASRRAGRIAVFVGNYRFLGHELRELGLRTYFREHAPEFSVLDSFVNLEERKIAYEATLDCLRRYPDLVGIYVAGGGMEGVIAALRDEPPPEMIQVVVNENTPDTRSALTDGVVTMVLATPLDKLVRELIPLMVRAISEGSKDISSQTFLSFDILVSENL